MADLDCDPIPRLHQTVGDSPLLPMASKGWAEAPRGLHWLDHRDSESWVSPLTHPGDKAGCQIQCNDGSISTCVHHRRSPEDSVRQSEILAGAGKCLLIPNALSALIKCWQ